MCSFYKILIKNFSIIIIIIYYYYYYYYYCYYYYKAYIAPISIVAIFISASSSFLLSLTWFNFSIHYSNIFVRTVWLLAWSITTFCQVLQFFGENFNAYYIFVTTSTIFWNFYSFKVACTVPALAAAASLVVQTKVLAWSWYHAGVFFMSTDCESITVKFNSKKRGQYSHSKM